MDVTLSNYNLLRFADKNLLNQEFWEKCKTKYNGLNAYICVGIKEVPKSSAIRGIELFRAAAPLVQWTARVEQHRTTIDTVLLLNKSQDSVLRAQEN